MLCFSSAIRPKKSSSINRPVDALVVLVIVHLGHRDQTDVTEDFSGRAGLS